MDFLKSLADKFLDFFNIGRAISILIPGALVSITLLMLLSLLAFPPQKTAVAVQGQEQRVPKSPEITSKAPPTKTAQPQQSLLASAKKAAPVQPIISGNKAGAGHSPDIKTPAGSSHSSTARTDLMKQLIEDYKRVASHHWLFALFSLVLGVLLYEVGNIKIMALGKKYAESSKQSDATGEEGTNDLPQLYRFSIQAAAEGKVKLEESKEKVGLIYFAPFLKDEFITGKENYYNFLISEYYRFLEFSAVMPLAIFVATGIAYLYYLTSCHLTAGFTSSQIGLVTLVTVLIWSLVCWFYSSMLGEIYRCYRKASVDLIRGIADAKNQDLFKSGTPQKAG